MTDPTPGTQVATRAEPKLSATQIMLSSPHADDRAMAYQAARGLARAKMIGDAAEALANTQWGKNISPAAAQAVARWALEAGVDPVRHIYVLGGKIYDNAELYMDKLAAMRDFDHAQYTILAPLDHRKIEGLGMRPEQEKQLLTEQQDLNAQRIRLQMEYEVPNTINDFPDTAAAVLVELFFKDGTVSKGVNWAGSRGRKKMSSQGPGGAMDPVGDIEPVKTAITRALRKAAKPKVPVWFKEGGLAQRFEQAEGLVTAGREEAKRLPKAEPTSQHIEGAGVEISTGGGQAVDQEAGYGEGQAGDVAQLGRAPRPEEVAGSNPVGASPAPSPVDQGDAFELQPGEIEVICPSCGQVEVVDEKTVPPNGLTGYDCSAGCPAKMLTRKALAEREQAHGKKGGR